MRVLYAFVSPSCAVCSSEAKPALEAFEREQRKVPIIRLNPNLKEWRMGGFRARYTPSYALVERGMLLGSVSARPLNLEELRAFVANPAEYAAQVKAAQKEAHDDE